MGPRAQPDLNSLSFDIFSLEIRDLRSYQKKYFNKQVLGARNLSLRKIPYTISHTEHSHLKSEPLFLSADYPKAKGLLCVGPREDEVMNLLHHPLSLSLALLLLCFLTIALVVISVSRILLIRRRDGMSE